MNVNRRSILASIGGITATGVGAGYWQRRRIRRWDDISEFQSIADIPTPTIEEPTMIPDETLRDGYDRATSRLSEAVDEFDGDESDLEGYQDSLEEHDPEAVRAGGRWQPTADDARIRALSSYAQIRIGAITALARKSEERGKTDVDAVVNRHETIDDRLGEIKIKYVGPSFHETIVTMAAADSYRADATRGVIRRVNGERIASISEDGPRTAAREEYALAWHDLENMTAYAEYTEAIVSGRDGNKYETALETTHNRLRDWIDSRREELPNPYDSAEGFPESTASYAADFSIRRPGDLSTEGPKDSALQVRHFALQVPLLTAEEEFTDVPHMREWEKLGYELGADGTDLREEKRDAINAVEDALERFPDDPLVDHLCGRALRVIGDADATFERLATDPQSYDDREWATGRDHSVLDYELARRYAEAIPETIELVDERVD